MNFSTTFAKDLFNTYYQIGLVLFGYIIGGYTGIFFLAIGLFSVPLISSYRANLLDSTFASKNYNKRHPPVRNVKTTLPVASQLKRKWINPLLLSDNQTIIPSETSLHSNQNNRQKELSEMTSRKLISSPLSSLSVAQTSSASAQLPLKFTHIYGGESKAITPNSRRPDSFATEGLCLIKIRTEPNTGPYQSYFEGRNRTFEFQVQGKFLHDLDHDDKIWFGIELKRKLHVGLIGKAIMNTVLALCERLVGGIHYSWGEKDGSDCSHVVFPLETTVDRLIITSPGEEPPPLCVGMLPEPLDKKARASLEHYYLAENTYTFSMHGMYVDFIKWAVVNFPGKKKIDIRTLLGDLPLWLVAYTVKKNDKIHHRDRKKYLFSFEIEHSGGEVIWVDDKCSVGNLSTTSNIIPAAALHADKTELSQESLHEVINKATLPEEGQETISISCPMYVIGANIQRGVWFVVKIWRKPKSAVTESEKEPSNEASDTVSALRSLGSIHELQTLHSHIHGSSKGFPEWKFSHEETASAFANSSLSTHSIELVRDDISNFLAQLLKTTEGRKTLTYFLDEHFNTRSVLFTGSLRELDLTVNYTHGAVSIEGIAGRAVWETRWMECWAVCYASRLCFYSKNRRKCDIDLDLRDVLEVQKNPEKYFPASFLNVATVGRVYYLAFDSKAKRDKWWNKLIAQVMAAQQNLVNVGQVFGLNDLIAIQESYASRSKHRWDSERILMNERVMYFGATPPGMGDVHPCDLMANCLRAVLSLEADSSREKLIAFLNEISKLKILSYERLVSLENHERVSFFINMYHCLMAHNLIIFGPPAMSSRTQFFQELNSYIKYDRQEI
ncbi:uncharacterized protein LOC135144334 isoform X2 [Zophobas morio]|uniref:uncharacterized protein LOC135144333 isoform X2 n=1 Tax=Zophobas morio TaxID=2755281 RepID=UPI003083A300